MKQQDLSDNKSALLAWFFITIFYCYQYVLRSFPNVASESIRFTFILDAESFSSLGFLYLIAYSVIQIPMGILVDRFGVRTIVLPCILLCSVGAFLFGLTSSFTIAKVARFLMGLGSAGAFLCALKIIADNFKSTKRGMLSGITLTAGTCATLVAGELAIAALKHISWQKVSICHGVFGLFILFISFFVIKSDVRHNQDLNMSNILTGLKQTLSNKYVIIYAILAIGLYTPLSAITDIWGSQLLKAKYDIPISDAASTSLIMYLGLAVGSLFIPYLMEKYKKVDLGILVFTILTTVLFTFIIYGHAPSKNILVFVLFAIGMSCGAEMLCFTGAMSHANSKNSGEVVGIVNTVNMLFGAFLQSAIGIMLDMTWSGAYEDAGLRKYSSLDFINAMGIVFALLCFCTVISFIPLLTQHKKEKI